MRLPRQAQRLFRRGALGFGLRQILLRRCKFRAHFLRLEQHRDFRVPCGDFPLQFPHPCLRPRLTLFIRANQFAQQWLDLLLRQPLLLGLRQARGVWRILPAGSALHGLPHLSAQFFTGAAFRRRRVFQRVLQRLIAARIEDLAENGDALFRGREQQLQKIALRDHGHLRELFAIHAQNVAHAPRHFLGARDHVAIRIGQNRFRALHGFAAAPGWTAVFRVAAHRIVLAAAAKGQFHKSGRLRRGKAAAQHGRFAIAAARLAIERERNRVEQHGLARAGITRNQIQALFAQQGKIQPRLARVGAKGG